MQTALSRRLVSPRLLTIIVTIILLSTVLFVVGVLTERSPTTLVPTSSSSQKAPAQVSTGDPDGGHEGTPSGNAKPTPTSGEPPGGSNERIFGLDLESPWFVAAFVLAWLLLMGTLFRLGYLAWLALLVVASVSSVLDVGEIARKVSEANTTVATFAVLVAVAHVSLAVLAGLVLVRGGQGRARPAAERGVL